MTYTISPIRTFYIRAKKRSDSNFTVVYTINYITQTVSLGRAACHKRDTFIKKQGRNLAMDRLAYDPIVVSLSKFPSSRYIDIETTLRNDAEKYA